MTVLPVIARELRASARQPFTYYLRMLGVAVLLVVGLLFGMRWGFDPAFGRQLFSVLHCSLFSAIWLLVPMLTADCISRERREGTLGLLFMTPLKGTDIVVAKGLVHGLRAVTLGLAVVPVLTIPFLVGGVSWNEAVMSVVINANAMCWALAAGLLASAWRIVFGPWASDPFFYIGTGRDLAGGLSQDPAFLAGGASLGPTALVAAGLLHPGSNACIPPPLDALETGSQPHRLVGTTHLERKVGHLGVVRGAYLDL
ncbi:MAG: hypothetical protein NT154_20560 [Verrucomicrobia bacterium]|nr:hypothetical protein [Verrucomicrobiota bacterium]